MSGAKPVAYARALLYLVRHKWFVLRAGRITGAPLWRLIVHDLSKLRPDEWSALVREFYLHGGDVADAARDRAWLAHQHRNAHHWQHWVLRLDCGTETALEMPEDIVREMVADWMAAGRTIKGWWDIDEWYRGNARHMSLHPHTRVLTERLVLYATLAVAKE